ncbi:uncharacterized protein ARB_06220 [Trichophyton benhamiae CBS 112371]|uniref:Uncharacterized protein n=1 Tax=Arthroderma benhamiae (strain ATCC MYA-4681 / CBS 112371) TaxID=663331 RepID=D4APQ2_ARTBC|nr:uncharacterized protein ARB_06220 [Trichophyton benhamiae CBS 112371]EFE35263.1 hypothetical protein ARB_06220 [Trichophyton benhamiae CBS 112371]
MQALLFFLKAEGEVAERQTPRGGVVKIEEEEDGDDDDGDDRADGGRRIRRSACLHLCLSPRRLPFFTDEYNVYTDRQREIFDIEVSMRVAYCKPVSVIPTICKIRQRNPVQGTFQPFFVFFFFWLYLLLRFSSSSSASPFFFSSFLRPEKRLQGLAFAACEGAIASQRRQLVRIVNETALTKKQNTTTNPPPKSQPFDLSACLLTLAVLHRWTLSRHTDRSQGTLMT